MLLPLVLLSSTGYGGVAIALSTYALNSASVSIVVVVNDENTCALVVYAYARELSRYDDLIAAAFDTSLL